MGMIRGVIRFESEERFVAWARKYAEVYGRQAYSNIEEGVAEVEEIIIHEKAHFEKARSLGYDPVYQVFGLVDQQGDPNNTIVDAYQVDYNGRRPTGEDLIEILLAPKIPSEDDLELANRTRKSLEDKSFNK